MFHKKPDTKQTDPKAPGPVPDKTKDKPKTPPQGQRGFGGLKEIMPYLRNPEKMAEGMKMIEDAQRKGTFLGLKDAFEPVFKQIEGIEKLVIAINEGQDHLISLIEEMAGATDIMPEGDTVLTPKEQIAQAPDKNILDAKKDCVPCQKKVQ